MKKKTKLILILVVSVTALLGTSSVLYSQTSVPEAEIENAFKELKAEVNENKNKGLVLVEGDGISVTYDRFIFYKKNAELVNSLQKNASLQAIMSDQDIIDELIATDLSVKYAREIGLTATSEEIDEVIQFERDALKGDDSENNLVRELMAQRINMTGLSEEEFWNSVETRYNYEKAILLGKLAQKLMEEKKIDNTSEIGIFQKNLLDEFKSKLQINLSLLTNN